MVAHRPGPPTLDGALRATLAAEPGIWTTEDLAADFGVHPETVRRAVRRLRRDGCEARLRRARRPQRPPREAEVRAWLAEGLSPAEIEAALGWSAARVESVIRRLETV